MCFFPWTLSFTNLFFVDAPDPLTGHSYPLHTLHVFVGMRRLTFVQKHPVTFDRLFRLCVFKCL